MTAALLRRLTDRIRFVRASAAYALAGQDEPEVVDGLLELLADEHASVRRAAAAALTARTSPRALLKLANDIRRLSQADPLLVVETAEQLMIRHYRQITPTEQPAVRNATGWLTVTVLTNG